MTVKQNEKGLWDVQFYYKDWTGKSVKKHKRNFKTKREAVAWVNQFTMQQAHNLNMDFKAFWEIYRNDMKERLRENTMRSKDYIVELKILPYFGNRNISEISAADIREWQNTLLKKGYSQTYLRTVNNQLSCIFNYAVKYYDLSRNPCRQAGTIGKSKADEMNFWTQDEFEQFISCMEDKPTSYCGFMILYWTGCRIGELLALTLEDFDEEEKTLRITKSYQRIGNRDVITDPKTKKGKRIITLPDFLVTELREYTGRLGTKQRVQYLVEELRETQIVMKEITEQILSGDFSMSGESYKELKDDYLAFMITMVDILNGAAYLFDKKPDSDNRHWKEQQEIQEYCEALGKDISGKEKQVEKGM